MSQNWWSPMWNRIWGVLVVLTVLCGAVPSDDQPVPDADTPNPVEPTGADKKFELKFKFTRDQIERYEVAYEMEMNSTYNEAKEKVRNQSETRRSYKVSDVSPEGIGSLELSIDWVRMVAEFDNGEKPSKPIEFQSDDRTKHPSKFLHILATVGKPTATIRFSPQGKVLEVVSIQPGQVQRNSEGEAPGVYTSQENYLIPLPEQPVAIDEVWKEQFDIIVRDSTQALKRVTLQRSYRLKDVSEGLATIEFRTTILTPVRDPAISGQLIYRETAGKVVFDLERGRIVSRDSAIERTVVGPFGPNSAMHAVIKYREKLLTDDKAASAEPTEAAASTKQ
ncbi:MAG: hypothetical protein EXS05_14855 [Planctomycetaceae bacterium]|nr:hypothetical protein [Planctomycetaceae bacterium]